MNAHFDNLALMTLSAWREGCFTLTARAWTPHTWTKNAQLEVAYCDCILRGVLNASRCIWSLECEACKIQYRLSCRGPQLCA